jgi:hypothetical protein
MYVRNNRKEPRYNGFDIQPWKVVDVYGNEKFVIVKDRITGQPKRVTRWQGFRPANAVAQKQGGFAVRA